MLTQFQISGFAQQNLSAPKENVGACKVNWRPLLEKEKEHQNLSLQVHHLHPRNDGCTQSFETEVKRSWYAGGGPSPKVQAALRSSRVDDLRLGKKTLQNDHFWSFVVAAPWVATSDDLMIQKGLEADLAMVLSRADELGEVDLVINKLLSPTEFRMNPRDGFSVAYANTAEKLGQRVEAAMRTFPAKKQKRLRDSISQSVILRHVDEACTDGGKIGSAFLKSLRSQAESLAESAPMDCIKVQLCDYAASHPEFFVSGYQGPKKSNASVDKVPIATQENYRQDLDLVSERLNRYKTADEKPEQAYEDILGILLDFSLYASLARSSLSPPKRESSGYENLYWENPEIKSIGKTMMRNIDFLEKSAQDEKGARLRPHLEGVRFQAAKSLATMLVNRPNVVQNEIEKHHLYISHRLQQEPQCFLPMRRAQPSAPRSEIRRARQSCLRAQIPCLREGAEARSENSGGGI